MAHLYILRSSKDYNLYVGATENLDERLKAHNAGRVKSTARRRPLVLIYTEYYQTMSEARKREWYLKNHPTGQRLKKKLAINSKI